MWAFDEGENHLILALYRLLMNQNIWMSQHVMVAERVKSHGAFLWPLAISNKVQYITIYNHQWQTNKSKVANFSLARRRGSCLKFSECVCIIYGMPFIWWQTVIRYQVLVLNFSSAFAPNIWKWCWTFHRRH